MRFPLVRNSARLGAILHMELLPGAMEDGRVVETLDIPLGEISESAQRVIDRAVTEATRRGHGEMTSGRVFIAFAQLEWNRSLAKLAHRSLRRHLE